MYGIVIALVLHNVVTVILGKFLSIRKLRICSRRINAAPVLVSRTLNKVLSAAKDRACTAANYKCFGQSFYGVDIILSYVFIDTGNIFQCGIGKIAEHFFRTFTDESLGDLSYTLACSLAKCGTCKFFTDQRRSAAQNEAAQLFCRSLNSAAQQTIRKTLSVSGALVVSFFR